MGGRHLFHIFYGSLTKNRGVKKNASGSTFLEISGNNLGKIMVLFPLIEEQQKK